MGDDGFGSAGLGQDRSRGINTSEQSKTPVTEKTPTAAQNTTPARSKTPLRLLSLLSPGLHLQSPNDDEEERARARAARARAQRRSFGLDSDRVGLPTPVSASEADNILSHDALKYLLQNCLKLSAANKINQGNTWDLKLIDHLSDLVKNDTEDEGRTNFQMASCTLETGVKIYSYRVDSVHSEAYKLMGGLSRNSNDATRTETSTTGHNASENNLNQESNLKGPGPKKVTGTTLEPSFEALNTKKLDVAFYVDPLFRQTSAQFDEGGARGLLLNNLSVYRGCEILFDSHEVPEKIMKSQLAATASEDRTASLDLSFLEESLDQMMAVLSTETEITPSLREILKLINDPSRTVAEAERNESQSANGTTEDAASCSPLQPLDIPYEDAASVDDPGEVDDHVDDGFDEPCMNGGFDSFSPQSETWDNGVNGLDSEGRDYEFVDGGEVDGPGGDTWVQDPLGWLTVGDGSLGKSNDWAGPGHWKYPKPKSTVPAPAEEQEKSKNKRKRKEPYVIDYENLPEIHRSSFEPSKNPRTSLMPLSNTFASILPEDYHFETSTLLKFFLRPSTWCCRRRGKNGSAGKGNLGEEDFTTLLNEARWDDDGDNHPNDWEDGNAESDVDDAFDLVAEPRKVQKIEVKYDKYSKQVDVRVLKQVLWKQLQDGSVKHEQDTKEETDEGGLSFQDIFKHIPEDCPAAVPEDISVHLCFICLLHLANEQNLRLEDCPSMDDLRVYNIPRNS